MQSRKLEGLAEKLHSTHEVDYCSMITGIHWPDGPSEKKWEVVYHFLRTGVKNPPELMEFNNR